ncbi:ribonuclease HII [Sedimentibacter sp. zth1]|uniref:ribonuclease HII n=1 Tax=Sedimentibacter sp. zth1 TaxID=2816908 RepID=UPI001A924ED3|nr:ribonuclease HII [Sedimentibacter sp. zth1]QSX06565.1 ribonuclease HII [Sedimentibacter sp. zth1]
MLKIENKLHVEGYEHIACIDEVGRGCLAGSVVTCAIVMPKGLLIEGVNDSKKLTPKKRDKLYDEILAQCIAVGIGEISYDIIDEINIKNATKMAMLQAVDNLKTNDGQKLVPNHLLIDAEKLDTSIPQTNVIKGDATCHGIAAASIIAKVTRDRQMVELDKIYPEYNFKSNKGYGTKDHIQALLKYGPIQIHRRTFLKKILDKNEQITLF